MAVKIERDRIVKVSELHNDTSKWVEAAQAARCSSCAVVTLKPS